MNREKFLKELEECLSELDETEKNSVISFYNDYFDKQISMGRTEADIIDELGNPRFLAKSIKDNYQNKGDGSAYHRFNESKREQFKSTTINIDRWYYKLIAAAIVILAILLVTAILAGILTIFLKIVVPVLIILIIVSAVKNIFNR